MLNLDYTLAKAHMEDLQTVAQRERLAKEAKNQNKQVGWFEGWFKQKETTLCEPQTLNPLASQTE
jgi:hypothetical protein